MTAPALAAWVEIDLAALAANLEQLQATAAARVAAVVKADAYGHGAVRIARKLERLGVELLIVARVAEANELRREGVEGRILVLAPPDVTTWSEVCRNRLEVACSTPAGLEFLLAAAADGPVPVHIKFNTGMNRLGLPPGEAKQVLTSLSAAPAVRVRGIFSHFADADLPESPRTKEQAAAFTHLAEGLAREFPGLETHLGNSAAMLRAPPVDEVGSCTFVRTGLALYGYDPSGSSDLEPVMSVHARVLQVHRLGPGDRVGYGGRWQAERPTRVGIIGVGYGDGYSYHRCPGVQPQLLTDRGPRPIVGAVSMDMLAFAADESELLDVGEEVTLLGTRGQHRITAHDLASAAGTVPYEVLLRLGNRLPRIHLD